MNFQTDGTLNLDNRPEIIKDIAGLQLRKEFKIHTILGGIYSRLKELILKNNNNKIISEVQERYALQLKTIQKYSYTNNITIKPRVIYLSVLEEVFKDQFRELMFQIYEQLAPENPLDIDAFKQSQDSVKIHLSRSSNNPFHHMMAIIGNEIVPNGGTVILSTQKYDYPPGQYTTHGINSIGDIALEEPINSNLQNRNNQINCISPFRLKGNEPEKFEEWFNGILQKIGYIK